MILAYSFIAQFYNASPVMIICHSLTIHKHTSTITATTTTHINTRKTSVGNIGYLVLMYKIVCYYHICRQTPTIINVCGSVDEQSE